MFHHKNLVLWGNFIIFLASLVCKVFYQPLKSLTVVTDSDFYFLRASALLYVSKR